MNRTPVLLVLAVLAGMLPAKDRKLPERPMTAGSISADAAVRTAHRHNPAPRDAWVYTLEWKFSTKNILCVGMTPVQDTLIWVSSGGHTTTTDPNWIFIFDARSHALLDSFLQATTTDWGYRDMCYDPVANVVYAGTDGNQLDKIDATSHNVIASYTVSGSATPGTVRALTTDGDSLYSANFTTSPVVKFAIDGTNSHQVAPIPPFAIYGLALARSYGKAYATTADNTGMVLQYDYPSWSLSDSMVIPELGIVHGGCEMWRGDTFLLVLGQNEPMDSVICLRIIPPDKDVGVTRVVPSGFIGPDSIFPQAVVKNFGTAPQSGFDVRMTIEPGGYTSTMTVSTVNPGDTVVLDFAPWQPVGAGISVVRCTTMLAGDLNPANDAKSAVAMVASFVYDLEANNAGFTPEGMPDPGWQWGEPGSPRPPAHSGTKVWGGALTGDYPNYADWKLNSNSFTASQDTPVVAFWHWYVTENRYDGGNLRLSTDGGATWSVLYPWTEYCDPYDDSVYTQQAWGYTGEGPGEWKLALFRIPVASGTGFTLRWRFTTDLSVVKAGWIIDDIAGVGFAPVQHDVGCELLEYPTGIIQPGTYTPKARVRNYGASTETFNVRFAIEPGGYTSTKTVTALAPLDSAQVVFDDWHADDSSMFTLRCTTMLSGDEAPNNDARSGMAAVPRFVETFEATNGAFTAVNSPDPGWQWGEPGSPRPQPPSPTKVWGAPLNGNYVNDLDWRLHSVQYNAAQDTPVVVFWHWYSLERTYDGGNLKLTTDNGATWTLIYPWEPMSRPYDATMNVNNVAIPGELAYSGRDTTWRQAWFKVPVATGTLFKLRWHMGTDGSVTSYDGWMVDDVTGIGFDILVGMADEAKPVFRNSLSAAPSPLTNRGRVNYSLARPGDVSVRLYDITGAVVRTVASGVRAPGNYTAVIDAGSLARGIYLLRMETESYQATRKLVIQ